MLHCVAATYELHLSPSWESYNLSQGQNQHWLKHLLSDKMMSLAETNGSQSLLRVYFVQSEAKKIALNYRHLYGTKFLPSRLWWNFTRRRRLASSNIDSNNLKEINFIYFQFSVSQVTWPIWQTNNSIK